MARYLITGGAGFIGSHLSDAFISQGHSVVVLDDFSSGNRDNLPRSSEALQIVEGDVAANGLDDRIGQIDAVFHLAALISGHDSLHYPHDYTRTNINGLLRVIEFIGARKVPRLVFASSSTVYGSQAGVGLTESILPHPISVYAATKLMGEHLVAMYSAVHGFSHCSLRFFNVYGPRQSLNHPYANVTCKFSHAAANALPVQLYGDGQQSRDFVYVDDVVRSLLLVLHESPSPVYNIGTGVNTRISDLIGTLEEISGKPLTVERKPEWPNDIRHVSADISRARDEIGYEAQVGLRQGLAQTIAAFQQERTRVEG